jgi:hypothetical protein
MKTMNLTLMLLFLAVCSFAQNVPSYVPSNGLVGWWPFNGNANDESGNGNNGTVNGATLTADRFGNNNGAYFFNGNGNYINLGNVTSLNFTSSFSMSCWISRQNLLNGNFARIIDKGIQGLSGGYSFDITPSFLLRKSGFSGFEYSQSAISENQWVHVLYVLDANTLNSKIYLDGVLETSTNITTLPTTTSTSFWIGGSSSTNNLPPNYWFKGSIDDLAFWNRALTQQEITNLYNGGICYQTITVTDTLLINTGITGFNPVTYENTIRIWPNPTYDHITIDAGDLNVMNGYSIRIVNALGQQMFQSAITQQQFYLDLSTWTGSGIYYVNIINAQGVTIDTRKIVLQ